MNNFFYYYFINALRVNFITINITKNCLKRIVNRKLKILIYSDLVYAESYCGTPKKPNSVVDSIQKISQTIA